MARSVRRTWKLLALVALLALVVAACGKDNKNKTAAGSSGGSKTYALAFVGALTGPNANLGINVRDGAKIAVDDANKQGGGVNIVLKEFDTAGDPAQASTLKDRFINDKQILGVVGPVFSGETKAVLPDLQAASLPMVSPSATNAALPTVVPNETVFHRVIPDDDVQGKGVADYITKKLGAKKVALIHDNTEYGKGLWEGVVRLVNAAGVVTALTDAIDPHAQDFSAAVNKVKAANPEVLFYGGYYAEAGRFKKQLTDAGVKATFISGDGSLDPGFIESAGVAGGEGALLTCPCNLATADAPGALGEYARRYKDIVHRDPGTYSTEGHDATSILIKGIKSGKTDRKALLDWLENDFTSYDGLSKKIEFEQNGNVKATGVFVFQVKSGKITLLGITEDLLKK